MFDSSSGGQNQFLSQVISEKICKMSRFIDSKKPIKCISLEGSSKRETREKKSPCKIKLLPVLN